MIDLGTIPGSTNTHALAINNNGWIVGSAGTSTGEVHMVLWQPTVIPEPISSFLFVTGGAVLAGRRYLRRKSA